MLKSRLCDYSDVYILVKGIITVTGQGANNATITADRNNKEKIFKSYALFTNCISKINNTQIDNAKNLNIVIPMYNLIECSDNYAKISGSLWQRFRYEPDDDEITDSESFLFKSRFTNNTGNAGNVNKMQKQQCQ